ncbi:GH92 family glycosyl hydrolase [Brachybacterium sp. p3-SID1565]|uniref:GH92 family glycosyl hydrolase n=1 Tax=Brachybacterium epidermidis TaxID=2781983 RepID=A0ABR9W040_9MICO|nr:MULTISPECIES: GH92 family glycosyl hydrolase [Brachybacterium]MBE9402825.1 GH92 family glycosyl hydrolase [Brachybacterium epidermidis]MCT1385927.1 GH92 family glycosyl hydrolase [Brachybacterium sp. p3-SID1565]
MIATDAAGPVGSPTSKDGAGFVAQSALRCRTRPGERLEQELPPMPGAGDLRGRTVGADDVLRCYLFPELDPGLTWGATYVAVDLQFEDGTRLSELGPVDQYGTEATARGMGEGRILYADQWNDVQVGLEAAAGRTIARVLLVADPPPAPLIEGTEDAADEEDARSSSELVTWIDGPYLAPVPQDPPLDDPVAWVDTRRGTYASGDFSRGNTLPLTAWPNGFAFFTPMTDARTRRWVYEYHRANDGQNRPRLQGIGISHQPSPWMGDRNQFVVMPLQGQGPDASPQARARAFDHARETARPDLYAVELDGGIGVRLAPTDHGSIQEYTFPADGQPAHLLLEGVDEHARIDAAGAVLDGSVHAWVDSGLAEGYARADGATRMYISAQLDPAPATVKPADGANPGASLLTFAPGTTRVTLRLVTSFIGRDQARRTYAQEVEGRSLEQVRAAAHAAWKERLDVIRVGHATPAQRRTLAGNLYRLNLYPNSHWENAGTIERPVPVHASPVLPVKGNATDTRTNAQVLPGRIHVNNGFWDTYRTAWPAYALLYPELCAELVDGFVQQFREGGWIARWSSPGYADCMTGTSSDIAFADAAVKGVPLPDPLGTYEAGLRNATVTPPFAEVGRKGNERAVFTGYVDTDTPESVSWALEAHINDAGLAAQAELLAADEDLPEQRRRTLREEAAYLRARSANYVLLFDPRIGFFQGRGPDGSFSQGPDDFDPCVWGGDFTETDGWNFAFHAPHDGEGLADLHGGREGLWEKLEEFFATPERADLKGIYGHVIHEMDEARAVRMGQFGMSNQPSHHIPFLFHHAGAPHRAMQIVREVQRRLFVGEQIGQGYPGDEDNGEMSAWWLLTALGLYPLQLASGRYHVVAPLFDRAEVRPLGGAAFTVVAEGQAPAHPYVTSLTVRGREHSVAAIEHAQLHGELRFTLAADPGDWGEVPPSPTPEGGHPEALVDLLETDPEDPLLDDDSRTERHWDTASCVIDLPRLPGPGRARFLTLTSGAEEGGDPIAWRLEGSDDGSSWTLLDERSDQHFRWRRQTRPFEIASPQECTHHRIVVIAAEGPLRLAQVELLL